MLPPVQSILESAPAVTSIVGDRIFQGLAPQTKPRPYVAWTIVTNVANLNLSDLPENDDQRIQVDCYSMDQNEASNLAVAVRDALEAVTHVVFGPVYFFEDDTRLHRWMMQPEFWLNR